MSKVFIHQTSEPAAVNNPLHQRPNPNLEIARNIRSDRRNLIVKFTGNLFVQADDNQIESILYRRMPVFLDFISQAMEEQRKM